MRGLKHRLPETRRGLLVAVFVAVALVLGGGGTPSAPRSSSSSLLLGQ